jgi:hypothetical protein
MPSPYLLPWIDRSNKKYVVKNSNDEAPHYAISSSLAVISSLISRNIVVRNLFLAHSIVDLSLTGHKVLLPLPPVTVNGGDY